MAPCPAYELALSVGDLDAAIAFSKLFGVQPAKVNWLSPTSLIAEPPLKLVLLEVRPGVAR
ncbi:MAG: hypothetical protein H6522_04920 [Mycolicibacterium sp.]|nr:hypothetical protein [Mycolicibacterium sp.]